MIRPLLDLSCRWSEIAKMIQAGSQDCYLQAVHHVSDFLEALVNYPFRMT